MQGAHEHTGLRGRDHKARSQQVLQGPLLPADPCILPHLRQAMLPFRAMLAPGKASWGWAGGWTMHRSGHAGCWTHLGTPSCVTSVGEATSLVLSCCCC